MKPIFSFMIIALAVISSTPSLAQEKVNKKISLEERTFRFREAPPEFEDFQSLAKLLNTVCLAIENNDFDTWRTQLSAGTLERVINKKFPRKFMRLNEYDLFPWPKPEVIYFRPADEALTEVGGRVYTMVLKVDKAKTLTRRVGFDPVHKLDLKDKEKLIGLHVVKMNSGTWHLALFDLVRGGSTPRGNR